MDRVVGWAVLGTLLVGLSACLVLPPLRLIERRTASLGRWRRLVNGLAVALGGVALWFAIPLLVHRFYYDV
jgi:hypothetical protein